MPSPSTALEIIRDALGLTNAVGVDQTLTADESSRALRQFNNLLEIFSTNNLAVYGNANQTFNTANGQAVYTIGPGGNFDTTPYGRPVRIVDPAYSVVNNASFPCISITQQEYNLILVKNQPQQWPNRYLYVNSFPLGLITFWPVPNQITPITFSIDRILSAIATVGETISFPPGYAMVFQYKLAIMLAPFFGKKIVNYPDIVDIANSSFADICRANIKLNVMDYGPDLVGNNVPTLQGFLGGYYT